MLQFELDFIYKVIQDQGLVAVMLAWMIIQNSKERKELLHKNCELNGFIMQCLKQKIDEDSILHTSSVAAPNGSRIEDLGVKGTITPTTPQPSANGP